MKQIMKAANLKGVDLLGVDLKGANLFRANCHNTILLGADLYGANLKGAIGLEVEQIKKAKNWQSAIYSGEFKQKLDRSK